MWDLIVGVPDHCLSFYFAGLPLWVAKNPQLLLEVKVEFDQTAYGTY